MHYCIKYCVTSGSSDITNLYDLKMKIHPNKSSPNNIYFIIYMPRDIPNLSDSRLRPFLKYFFCEFHIQVLNYMRVHTCIVCHFFRSVEKYK